MGRQATGSIHHHVWKDGQTVSWYLRVRAYGERWRINLGTSHEGWGEQRARVELDRVLAQIQRGTWEPPTKSGKPKPQRLIQDETLRVTTSRWWAVKQHDLDDSTVDDYKWRMGHFLGRIGSRPTAEITTTTVDELRAELRADGLAPRSTNMVLLALSWVLEQAIEEGILAGANPAVGRKRRAREDPREKRRKRSAILEPDMVKAIIERAGEWEAEIASSTTKPFRGRRALIALLILAGPRIREALAAKREDFDLVEGIWRIPDSKTPSGIRRVDLTMRAAEELREHVAATGIRRGLLWPTREGNQHRPGNVRKRVLYRVIDDVNESRENMLIPKLTPHGLRRTFASLALAAGRNPRWVMAQLGHSDPKMTLGTYAQVIERRTIDIDLVWALMRFAGESEKPPTERGFGPTNGPMNPVLPPTSPIESSRR